MENLQEKLTNAGLKLETILRSDTELALKDLKDSELLMILLAHSSAYLSQFKKAPTMNNSLGLDFTSAIYKTEAQISELLELLSKMATLFYQTENNPLYNAVN